MKSNANANVHCYPICGRVIVYCEDYFESCEPFSNGFTGGPVSIDLNELKFCICYNIHICLYVLDVRYIHVLGAKFINFLNRKTYDGKWHLSFGAFIEIVVPYVYPVFCSLLFFFLLTIQVFSIMLDSSL